VISGLLFDGREKELLRGARVGLFVAVTSQYVLDEITGVLHRKFGLSLGAVAEVLSGLATEVVPEPPPAAVAEAESLLRDPKDVPVLAAAIAAEVDGLVTGDKDLHTREVKKRLRVLTTREALEWLGIDS
jgi:putative PIN family toxin of toxin-antitoxin system